jgi:hypothetical protein
MKKRAAKKKMDVQESLDFIIEKMATKDDVREIVREEIGKQNLATKDDVRETVRETEKRLHDEIVSKTGGIERRLDQELDKRNQLEVRIVRLEQRTR